MLNKLKCHQLLRLLSLTKEFSTKFDVDYLLYLHSNYILQLEFSKKNLLYDFLIVPSPLQGTSQIILSNFKLISRFVASLLVTIVKLF
jgi:hypothetical protein